MKKYLLLLSLLSALFQLKLSAGTYSGGTGTSEDPYQLSTTVDLIELSNTLGDRSKYFILTGNIIFNEDETQVDWNGDNVINDVDTVGFTGIGQYSKEFSGSFDGRGYSIANLFVDRPNHYDSGLFRNTKNATIRNIRLLDFSFISSDYCGGIAGTANNSTFTDIFVSGSINGQDYIGGICGSAYNVNISYCTAVVTFEGTLDVGAIVGSARNSTDITFCSGSGSITGTLSTGGVVGYIDPTSSISNCYSNAYVLGINNCGGVVGTLSGTISNCYATGSVSGDSEVGGFVGYTPNGIINNSYSTGSVSGSTHAGGFAGYNLYDYVSNSFWDTQTSGQGSSAGGTGKTTAEMKSIMTFTDENTIGLNTPWDFVNNPNDDISNNDFWNINSLYNNGYPFLAWQLFITTNPVSDIDFNTASGNASMIGPSTSRGFCWNLTGSPTTDDANTIESGSWSGDNIFSAELTGLDPNQMYYIRAYASNSMGTFYGNEVSFATIPTLGEWGLIAFGTLTALLGGWVVYRKIV